MIKMLFTVTILQLCTKTLDYKAQIIQRQHFEIEQLTRVNKYLQDLSYKKDYLLMSTYLKAPVTSELDGL